jgi:hypothetical protein
MMNAKAFIAFESVLHNSRTLKRFQISKKEITQNVLRLKQADECVRRRDKIM